MKPLLINTFTSGGAAKACIRLHNALHEINISSTLLTRDQSNEELKNHIYFGQNVNAVKKNIATFYHKLYRAYSIHSKPQFLRELESFNDPQSSYRIENLPIVQNADIINLHWVNNFVNYESFFKHVNKPIVWTLHDMQPFSGGYAYEYDFPTEKGKKRVIKNIQTKVEALKNKNIHVVTLNHWMEKISSHSEAFKSFEHSIIPNSINTSVFQRIDKIQARKELGLPLDEKIALFVAFSAKVKRKGFHILVEVLKHLQAEKIKVVTIGESAELGNSSTNITSLGTIRSEQKLAQIYSAADVFILPSLADNSPNTVLESHCCGTPVVGFNIGGVPELIDYERNGIIVKNEDSRSFFNGIMNAMSINWDNNQISQLARNKYSRKRQATEYNKLFKRLH